MEYGILITKEIRKMIQIKFIFIKYRKVHLIIIIKIKIIKKKKK